jgi:hypothetical protein
MKKGVLRESVTKLGKVYGTTIKFPQGKYIMKLVDQILYVYQEQKE